MNMVALFVLVAMLRGVTGIFFNKSRRVLRHPPAMYEARKPNKFGCVGDCAPEIGAVFVISLDADDVCTRRTVNHARHTFGTSGRVVVSPGVDLRGDDASVRSNLTESLLEVGVSAAIAAEAVERVATSEQRSKINVPVLAVSVAHARAWKRAAESGAPAALVLESDASVYARDFCSRFCHLWKRRPQGVDYYQLAAQVRRFEGCGDSGEANASAWREGSRGSAGAYVLTAAGAATLLEDLNDPKSCVLSGCPADVRRPDGLAAAFTDAAPDGTASTLVGNGVVNDGDPKWKYVVDQCGLIFQNPTCGSARESRSGPRGPRGGRSKS